MVVRHHLPTPIFHFLITVYRPLVDSRFNGCGLGGLVGFSRGGPFGQSLLVGGPLGGQAIVDHLALTVGVHRCGQQ